MYGLTKSLLNAAVDVMEVDDAVEDSLAFLTDGLPLLSGNIANTVPFSGFVTLEAALGEAPPPLALNSISSSLELVDRWSSSCSCFPMFTPPEIAMFRF